MVYSFCPLLGGHPSHATFFSSLTTSVTIHMAIYCQYVLASGVSLALSPFGCHRPAVSSLLKCILVTLVHLSLMQTVTCLTIVSHFTLHLFASSCLLSYLLINTLLAAYFSLFAPHCYCPPMYFYHCIFLHLCTLCSLHTPCLLHARSAMHSYCPMHTHCLLTTLHALVIHSTLVASSSPVASASWWLYAHSLLWAHFLSLMVLPTLCIFTTCNTILVWGILVAHLTPLAHRCSLHYVQSQFSLIHHFFPNYLLFLDTLIALHALFHLRTLVTLFTFLVLYTLSVLCTLIAPLMLISSFMLITSSF